MLAVPGLMSMRGRWHILRRQGAMVAAYGVIAVAGAQLFYFNAIQTLPVGVALMLEYLGIVLVVAWMWIRHGQRPRRLTLGGSAAALTGLALVLGVIGHVRLDLVGVLWGLGAGVGLATYFVVGSHSSEDLPPLALASGGMAIGAAVLLALGGVGALPMHATFGTVSVAGHRVSWLIPIAGLSLVAAVIAYVAGIAAARHARRQARVVRGPGRGHLRGADRLAAARPAAHRGAAHRRRADRRGHRAGAYRRAAVAFGPVGQPAPADPEPALAGD